MALLRTQRPIRMTTRINKIDYMPCASKTSCPVEINQLAQLGRGGGSRQVMKLWVSQLFAYTQREVCCRHSRVGWWYQLIQRWLIVETNRLTDLPWTTRRRCPANETVGSHLTKHRCNFSAVSVIPLPNSPILLLRALIVWFYERFVWVSSNRL